jgi:hypothetical protein
VNVILGQIQWFLVTSVRGIMNTPLMKGIMTAWQAECEVATEAPPYQYKWQKMQVGGWRRPVLTYTLLSPFLTSEPRIFGAHTTFQFVDHVAVKDLTQYDSSRHLVTCVPPSLLVRLIPAIAARRVAESHGIMLGARASIAALEQALKTHECTDCVELKTVFTFKGEPSELMDKSPPPTHEGFPPSPLSKQEKYYIIQSVCKSMDRQFIEESGCAVCGLLTPSTKLSPLSAIKKQLHILAAAGVSRKERKHPSDKIEDCDVVIDKTCDQICTTCRAAVRDCRAPPHALA